MSLEAAVWRKLSNSLENLSLKLAYTSGISCRMFCFKNALFQFCNLVPSCTACLFPRWRPCFGASEHAERKSQQWGSPLPVSKMVREHAGCTKHARQLHHFLPVGFTFKSNSPVFITLLHCWFGYNFLSCVLSYLSFCNTAVN